MKMRIANKASPGGRLAAVVSLIASHNIRNLAKKELGVDHSLLGHIRAGRLSLSERMASKIEEVTGISSTWLLTGEGAVFKQGRSPGKGVAEAIKRQVDFGPVHTQALPVIDDLTTLVRLPASDMVQRQGEKIGWYEHPQRSVYQGSRQRKHGFYLALSDETASLVGGMPGDLVMFVPFAQYRQSIPIDGEQILCMAKGDRGMFLCSGVWIPCMQHVDTRRDTPPDNVLKRVMIENYRGAGRRVFDLVTSEQEPRRIKDILAVAVWLERYLLPFAGGAIGS